MEVLRVYSNRPDLQEQLRSAVDTVGDSTKSDGHATVSDGGAKLGNPYRLRDRFTDEDVQALVSSYEAGVTRDELAKQYGICTRSVSRLVKRYRKQQADQAASQ